MTKLIFVLEPARETSSERSGKEQMGLAQWLPELHARIRELEKLWDEEEALPPQMTCAFVPTKAKELT
jgi:hypothetical protein